MRRLIVIALAAALLAGCSVEVAGFDSGVAALDASTAASDAQGHGPDSGAADSGAPLGADAATWDAAWAPDAASGVDTGPAAPADAALPDAARPDAAAPDASAPDAATDAGPVCDAGLRTWYLDVDHDGFGDPASGVTACEAPVDRVANGTDNCPGVYNPGQEDVDSDGVGDACVASGTGCDDLAEDNVLLRWTSGNSDVPKAQTTLSVLPAGSGLSGRALRAVTLAGFDFWVRYSHPAGSIDASGSDELRLAVRGLNTTTYGWQGNVPVLVLEDSAGRRRTLTPTATRLGLDGATWTELKVPLAGGSGWTMAETAALDLARIAAIEVHADTWDYGFTLDVDAAYFATAGASCPCPCQRGTCAPGSLQCDCDLGYSGAGCTACSDGFVASGGACVPPVDGSSSVWPNAFSKVNGDAWLRVHHDEIARVEPQVLVVNFANPSTPAHTQTLLGQITSAFSEASRTLGATHASAPAQLAYQIAKTVDLRDGVGGRPAAPAGWPYDNSALYPATGSRPATYDPANPPAFGSFDYARLFDAAFAQHYGYPDPATSGRFLTLCELVEQGIVNEVWIVASGDKPDAAAAEVLETKPRYTRAGNRIPNTAERCAGNGCFDAGVPFCGRSVRVGFVNYARGPGCYMESLSHGLESAMNHQIAPALTEWFLPFGNFDLDARYALPFSSFYAMGCPWGSTCLSFPTQTSVRIATPALTTTVSPYDARCGNVHFTPCGTKDYDIDNAVTVQSSCVGFGRHQGASGADVASTVNGQLWMAPYGTLASDCDGPFLVWWWQAMPGHGSGQSFGDGRAMKSVFPFLYY